MSEHWTEATGGPQDVFVVPDNPSLWRRLMAWLRAQGRSA